MKYKILFISVAFSCLHIFAQENMVYDRHTPSSLIGEWKAISQTGDILYFAIEKNEIRIYEKSLNGPNYTSGVIMETNKDENKYGEIYIKFYEKRAQESRTPATIRDNISWKFTFLDDFLYIESNQNKLMPNNKRIKIQNSYILTKE